MRRISAFAFVLALLLTGCAELPAPMLPQTLAPAAADAVTLAVETAQETLPEPKPELPPEPLPLPESVSTNITDAAAREIIAEMAALAEAWELGVSYISGDGAWYASVNGAEKFPSASTIKPIYCQYLLEAGVKRDRAVLHDVTLARTSTTGRFVFGESYTVEALMRAAVESSDNLAYRILFSEFGRWGYNAWAEKLGLTGLIFPTPYEFMDVSAEDLSAGTLAILQRSSEDATLVTMMKNADHQTQIAAGTAYECASKYGFEGWTLGYHDTAIVYAPAPYVLTVMSHIWPYAPDADRPFADMARLADALNGAVCE